MNRNYLSGAAVPQIFFTGKVRSDTASLRVRVLSKSGELEAIAGAWDRMPSAGATPMQDSIWHLSCAESLIGKSELTIIVVEDNAGLHALAPLMRSRAFPGGYELLGVRALYEPSNLLYVDKSSLNVLLEALSRLDEPLVLRRVCADEHIPGAFLHAFSSRGIVLVRDCGSLPYIDLRNPGGGVETLLSGQLRRDLRRARRMAEASGRVDFEIHAPASVREFLPLFKEVLRIEAAGWKTRAGTALAANTLHRDFFCRYGMRAAEKGILRIAFMRIDSQAVAMQFAVQTGGSFWLLKIGYNEEYSKCSPGMLLMYETLRFAERSGLVSYEFLGRSEKWTRRWTTHERPSVRVDAYPFTVKGMLAFGQELTRCAWIRTFRKLRGYQ